MVVRCERRETKTTYRIDIMSQDESKTPLGVDKLSRYGWETQNKKGDLRWLPKTCLNVDGSYQRDPKHRTKILDIARNWNWVSLAAIVVSQRSDDTYWVIDGQHRVMAAMKRSDVDLLPCVVHQIDNVQREAEAFIDTNTGRKPVQAHEKHKAALLARDEVAIMVQELLDSGGKHICTGGSAADGIKCIGLLNKLVSRSYDDLATIWPLICELTRGVYCSERIVDGLLFIEKHMPEGQSLSDRRWRNRILSIGNDDLVKAAGEGAAFFSKGGARPWAAGMINRINKGLRTKLEVQA